MLQKKVIKDLKIVVLMFIGGLKKKLGRKLKTGEVVHHRDGNTLNNSPNNLKVYRNQSTHMKKEH